MNKYKVKDANLARLINTFVKTKGFSYIAYVGEETFQINIYYKKYNFNICIYKDDKIYQNIVFRDDKYEMEIITILPTDSKILDGFGLAKGYHELCKLIGCDNELSSDETCLLDFNYGKDSSDGFSLREEKKRVSRKMKPYYLAFKDISFKDVRSKVKTNESLIKKYFVIRHVGRGLSAEYQTTLNGQFSNHAFTLRDGKDFYEIINKILKDSGNSRLVNLVPVIEWYVSPAYNWDGTPVKSIQVTPINSIQEFIDECLSGPLPKSPYRFKYPNPRIINKKQLQNYVSEYNNDRDFYEYLSSNSGVKS